MTQEVQPLTWSKRTNIEEHQQFFSKINEIIGNLAPTVDEAEQAIAQATAAIASANDAVATANAASAAASAAASQAQTAASAVTGYDARLTAAEGDIDALQGRMGTAEAKNSQQDTAIGALQNADAQNVKINAVNQYAVGLTGNQNNIAGAKIFLGECAGTAYFGLTNKRASFTIGDRSAKNRSWFRLMEDTNSNTLISGFYDANDDGTNQVILSMNIGVGDTTKTIEIVRVVTDASGNVTLASVGGKVIA